MPHTDVYIGKQRFGEVLFMKEGRILESNIYQTQSEPQLKSDLQLSHSTVTATLCPLNKT